jgi:hypothetical protein
MPPGGPGNDLGGYDRRGVESVEPILLSTCKVRVRSFIVHPHSRQVQTFPFTNVSLGWPAIDGGEPERRPSTFGSRSRKFAIYVVAGGRTSDQNLLFGVYRARKVVDSGMWVRSPVILSPS